MSVLTKVAGHLILVVLLTATTQVGGVIWLLCLMLMYALNLGSWTSRIVLFLGVYLISLILVVPLLARQNDRRPLPFFVTEESNIRPHTIFTALAFRNYVKPELKAMLEEVSKEMKNEFPGITVEYLDANYPLLKRFRMLPHLKHDNGKKLDIAFIYKKDGHYGGKYFSLFGYGFSVKPAAGETDRPAECAGQGRWQYNIIEKWVPDQAGRKLEFAVDENSRLMQLLARHPVNRFIFIEPHLRERLQLLEFENIRSFGCWAVRHDDHAHVQAN